MATGSPISARAISAPPANSSNTAPVRRGRRSTRRRRRRRSFPLLALLSRAWRDAIAVYALLEGASVTGAYRFIWHNGKGVWGVSRRGCSCAAPCRGSALRRSPACIGFRDQPRHGFDGVRRSMTRTASAIATGTGERLWRPLNNPPRVMTSTFLDRSPKGFGLLQRDRQFEAMRMTGSSTIAGRRWGGTVERLGGGSGPARRDPDGCRDPRQYRRLWVPAGPRAGSAFTFAYRIYGRLRSRSRRSGQVVATRRGAAGRPRRASSASPNMRIDLAAVSACSRASIGCSGRDIARASSPTRMR